MSEKKQIQNVWKKTNPKCLEKQIKKSGNTNAKCEVNKYKMSGKTNTKCLVTQIQNGSSSSSFAEVSLKLEEKSCFAKFWHKIDFEISYNLKYLQILILLKYLPILILLKYLPLVSELRRSSSESPWSLTFLQKLLRFQIFIVKVRIVVGLWKNRNDTDIIS